ncbi:hypothetical protein NQ318_010803 [Aromia moschata]|uniref:Transposase n=1 Tax=Aromia moschata TaxID=1265417 RepID=A0AAV8XDV9_9CUCU|nr:hypothetical protein NQ318_010803 [Aromia moschata]
MMFLDKLEQFGKTVLNIPLTVQSFASHSSHKRSGYAPVQIPHDLNYRPIKIRKPLPLDGAICMVAAGATITANFIAKAYITTVKFGHNHITQFTVSKIESKFRETGDVKDLPKSGRPKITQDKKIDFVLSREENPQSTSTLVASKNEVSQTTVLRILRKENYHPYKFQLVQELNEDDPDQRLQFCETMMSLCQTNPNLHQQILFSDEATFCLNGKIAETVH